MKSKKLTPLVSICIPTYNRPQYLLKAVSSCLQQTYQNFEIIISDNSLDDISEKMIRNLNHPLIRYYKNKENIGSFLNFSGLLNLAQGKYIKYLMDDDLLEPECLEMMLEAFETNKNIGVVMAPLLIIDQYDKIIHPTFYLLKKMKYLYRYQNTNGVINKSIIMKDYLTRLYPCCIPSGIMYRKECFDRLGCFDANANFAIDVEICMRFALEYDFYYIDKPLASWRFTSESDTVQIHRNGLNCSTFYYISEKFLNNENTKKLFSHNEWNKIVRDSYLFASRRSLLSISSGIKSLQFSIIKEAIKDISKRDIYFTNKIKLPWIAITDIAQCLKSWFENESL